MKVLEIGLGGGDNIVEIRINSYALQAINFQNRRVKDIKINATSEKSNYVISSAMSA